MSFNDLEAQRVKNAAKAFLQRRRPPARVRRQVDFNFRINGQSVELFEVRPRRDDPARVVEQGIAKATYVKSRHVWKVYWMRADLKWHLYQPNSETATVDEFFALVERDEHACFFG